MGGEGHIYKRVGRGQKQNPARPPASTNSTRPDSSATEMDDPPPPLIPGRAFVPGVLAVPANPALVARHAAARALRAKVAAADAALEGFEELRRDELLTMNAAIASEERAARGSKAPRIPPDEAAAAAASLAAAGARVDAAM